MILFEDNPEAAVSKLLKSILKEHVDFTGSNTNFGPFLEKYAGESVFCVFDLSPHNKHLFVTYDELRTTLRKYPNARLITIPCVEYSVLLMLHYYHINNKDPRWQEFSDLIGGNSIPKKLRFEGLCKQLLKSHRVCLRNVNVLDVNPDKLNTENWSAFYLGDCQCAQSDALCSSISQFDKSVTLLHLLPIASVLTNTAENLETYLQNHLQTIQHNASSFYNKLAVAMGSQWRLEDSGNYYNINDLQHRLMC